MAVIHVQPIKQRVLPADGIVAIVTKVTSLGHSHTRLPMLMAVRHNGQLSRKYSPDHYT
jgi:hypothetical protein